MVDEIAVGEKCRFFPTFPLLEAFPSVGSLSSQPLPQDFAILGHLFETVQAPYRMTNAVSGGNLYQLIDSGFLSILPVGKCGFVEHLTAMYLTSQALKLAPDQCLKQLRKT